MIAIEDITSEAGQLLAVDHLRRTAPRLRILPGHAANADNPLPRAPDEDQAHLQEQLDLGLNGVLLAVVEQLGAVPALQEEGVAGRDVAQVRLEPLDLGRVDNGRHAAELVDGGRHLGRVWVGGGLLDGLCPPGGGVPFWW